MSDEGDYEGGGGDFDVDDASAGDISDAEQGEPTEVQEGVEGAESSNKAVPKEERITTKYLTKYERARILGTRALQISMGAPVMVELGGESDPLLIAQKELKEKKIPITIRRFLPDGSYEDWNVDELYIE
eukprot:Plantae.Rhodophyta-Purpureofilum_apyrenoidigerum.ctg9580.p1 GENE.Plantae.Rhodophyta-Purpureofilum_apyrenoidigerum.ctg9580~~Plantae.Rhodophyta-Purpureofilum_apyrenoidigerum.ctg9580.p1  ORF type:complete len:130 (-),score=26.09 Plantae.Rhodophyta-Purpureofilum_apyrenoidigerum.ctg9580:627-1016(-)